MRSMEKWVEIAHWVDEVNAALSLSPPEYGYGYEEKKGKKAAPKEKSRDKEKVHGGAFGQKDGDGPRGVLKMAQGGNEHEAAALMEEEKDDHDDFLHVDDVIELPGRRMQIQVSGTARKVFGGFGTK